MESEDRLSTRDIASPGGGDTAPERDATLADNPPADTAAAPPERADREYDVGGRGAVSAERAGEGDVVTDEPSAGRGPSRESIAGPGAGDTADGDAAPLLADAEGFQARWEEIQVRFVDEPRGAVEDADALVATVMQRLAEGFAQERERLEAQWGRGEDISTEDLRVALQRYRSFFRRLLST